MIQHHHALDAISGRTVSIDEVTTENRTSMQFFCIGCGTEMEAVLGQKREHHFRHKEVGDCNPETYLHRLTKRVLKHKFETQSQFPVQYYVQNECPKFEQCEFRQRNYWGDCSSVVLKTLDLKEFYDTCEEEVSYKGFRADLMLSHSKFPDRKPVFLEVSVTHDCTPEKIDSRIRIIEIKVQCEKDTFREVLESENELAPEAQVPRPYWNTTQQPQVPPIRFYNFKRKNLPKRHLTRFYMIRSDKGIYYAGFKPDDVICHDANSTHEKYACFEVTISEDKISQKRYGRLYVFGLALARKRGLDIKSCILCQQYRQCIINQDTGPKQSTNSKPVLVSRRIRVRDLSAQDLEERQLAYGCPRYKPDEYHCQRIIQSFHSIPYWEWRDEVSVINNHLTPNSDRE